MKTTKNLPILYKNLRTGEISERIKVMQSSWDKSSDPEKIKDFFSYINPKFTDVQNGDIIIEIDQNETKTN